MTSATAKTLARHLAAINAGAITKTNVIGLRKAINAAERRSKGWSVPAYAPTLAQIAPLCDALEALEPRVTDKALHDSGIKLLSDRRYRKRLEAVADIVADIDHFRLIGFEAFGRNGEYSVPRYMAVRADGVGFVFYAIPWQTAMVGGWESGPHIVGPKLRRQVQP